MSLHAVAKRRLRRFPLRGEIVPLDFYSVLNCVIDAVQCGYWELHSAAALVKDGGCEWSHAALARLHVRDLSDDFIEHSLTLEWPAIGHTVGAFRIEEAPRAAPTPLFPRLELPADEAA